MKYLIGLVLLISSIANAEIIKTVEFKVEINFVDDYKDIPLNKGFNYTEGYPPYLGATLTNKFFSKCVIFVKEPTDVSDYTHNEILGHEIVHCYKGDYHSDPLRDLRQK